MKQLLLTTIPLLILLLLLSSCSSPQKELIGKWKTHQEENGVSMDMAFVFEQDQSYSVEISLGYKGDIMHDTTLGEWEVAGDKLSLGKGDGAMDNATFTITNDTLAIYIDSDTMLFERQEIQ